MEVDREVIRKIMEELPNNKAIGFAEVTNEMFKYSCIEEITIIVSEIIKQMIRFGEMPYFFNVGKIMPIIKDDKESNSELNNIRPITVSDVLANIFEKYVCHHIELKHKDPDVQFGFKKNSSTNHAVYVLDETIKHSKKKKKEC